MGKLFKPRNKTYSPQAGDTLKSIAAAETAGLTWQDIALFNWATQTPVEVNRCVLELLGCKEWQNDPGDTLIDPARGPGGAATDIFIPELWTGNLAVNQNHVVNAKKLKPAPAITLQKLDKWFIPKIESCDVKYQLHGIKERAKQVSLDVFGSGYCEVNDWKEGFGDFGAPLIDEPVFKKLLHADATERLNGDLSSAPWKGETDAANGYFKASVPRYLNVAFSPYTVQLRYFKVDADKQAQIVLAPFWPEFESADPAAKAKADSLKLHWEIKQCDKLKQGHLVVVDKDDKPVFLQALSTDLLTAGTHEFDFSAAGGRDLVAPDKMPYRVAVHAHSDMDEDDGIALAAMHTEVRLYVAPATHAEDLDPYDAATNVSSMALQLADLWHKDTALTKAADARLWTKFALAEAGFHPGPVTDDSSNNHYKRALHEFQKSVPKKKANPADDFSRLTVSDNDDADTRDALETMANHYKRPWFGKAADRSDYANGSADLKRDLTDPSKEIICWVDDRYWYSDGSWVPEDNTQIRNNVRNHASALTEDRGSYTAGDNRVTMDERDIARPWIPLEMQPVLLAKADSLVTVKNPAAIAADVVEASRLAIGPLRVDWTFDEIDSDTINVDTVDTAMYHKERTRTKAAVEWQLDTHKTQHPRKDVKGNATYFNCLEKYGGVRPPAIANYFKAIFGQDAESLYPWTAKADAARESIVTVVHDNLGEKHKAEDQFAKRTGRAGIYFHPSNMAGDGYQLRAQIRFEKNTDYTFANSDVLVKRYPKMPQSHSAKIRLWRKASLRGYVCWGPTDSFAGSVANFRKVYEASHMHFVNENGLADGAVKFPPNVLFSNIADYRTMVKDIVNPTLAAPGNLRRQDANIVVTPDRLWPWHGHDQLGIPEPSAANPANGWAAANTIYETYAEPYYYRLAVRLSSEIARQLEAKQGLMRGNVIVEMQSSDQVDYRSYDCDTCNRNYIYLEKNGVAPPRLGQTCPHPTCAGSLMLRPLYIGHYTCANGHQHLRYEANSTGGSQVGSACTNAGCGTALAADTQLHQRYSCSVCNFNDFLPEANPAGGSSTGSACPRTGCAGVLNPTAAAPSNANHVELWPSQAVQLYGNLPLASLGNPIGVAINFDGGYELWAHEVGHTRYMEHAANAPASRGGTPAQSLAAKNRVHDAQPNPDPLVSADAVSSNWDRACYMTYASHLANFDPVKDKTYMCYKCLLKNRGWKIENIPNDPPGAVHDV